MFLTSDVTYTFPIKIFSYFSVLFALLDLGVVKSRSLNRL
nr:MAG TPA: hypothetical protein [Caudoviricetes sp.]